MSAGQRTGTGESRSDRPLPTVGSKWRARRRGEERRTVEVVSSDEHFTVTRTLTTTWGDPPRKATTTRLRSHRFHYEFDPLADSGRPT